MMEQASLSQAFASPQTPEEDAINLEYERKIERIIRYMSPRILLELFCQLQKDGKIISPSEQLYFILTTGTKKSKKAFSLG